MPTPQNHPKAWKCKVKIVNPLNTAYTIPVSFRRGANSKINYIQLFLYKYKEKKKAGGRREGQRAVSHKIRGTKLMLQFAELKLKEILKRGEVVRCKGGYQNAQQSITPYPNHYPCSSSCSYSRARPSYQGKTPAPH